MNKSGDRPGRRLIGQAESVVASSSRGERIDPGDATSPLPLAVMTYSRLELFVLNLARGIG